MPPLALSPTIRLLPRLSAWMGRLCDLPYPPACVACAAPTAAPHGLCAPCWRAMPWITAPFCQRLGLPFAYDGGAGLVSPAAMARPPVFARARSVARYEGVARDLVHRLKYGDRLDLAPAMGAWMAAAGQDLLRDSPLLVPVPLHPWRLWRRRHNQASLLAAALGRRGLAVDHRLLRRRRATRPQVGLTRNERAENLQGAFAVDEARAPRLVGARVVLVDDVMTTGSTANAAARVLLRAGATEVDVLTFALVCTAP
ncbi:ComF family protein [Alsobacter sp. R-9]